MKTATTINAALLVITMFLTSPRPIDAETPNPKERAKADGAVLSKEDEAGVRKVVTDFESGWNTHDMKLLATLLRDDAEFVNVVGMHWRGLDAIVKAHAIFHEIMFKDCKVKTDTIEARLIAPDCAVAVVTETQDGYTTPDGHVMPKGQVRLNYIMTKGSDGWKIAHAANIRIDAEAAKHDPVNAGPK